MNFKEKYVHIAVGLIVAAILTYIVCENIYQWFAWNAAPNLDQPYGAEIQWDRVWVFWAGLSFFSIPVGFGIGVAVSVLFSRASWFIRSRIMDLRSLGVSFLSLAIFFSLQAKSDQSISIKKENF